MDRFLLLPDRHFCIYFFYHKSHFIVQSQFFESTCLSTSNILLPVDLPITYLLPLCSFIKQETLLTHSDPFLKNNFPNFESFDSHNWVGDKPNPELLLSHIIRGDSLDTHIMTIRTDGFTFTFCGK